MKFPIKWLHGLLFVGSFVVLWFFKGDDWISLLLLELCALYIAVTHASQKELIPPLAILIGAKVASIPLWIMLFSDKTVSYYLIFIIGYNLLLASALVKFYRHPRLRKIFGVSTPSRKIPQVLAMATMLGFAAGHLGLVLIEVRLYDFEPTIFDGIPFFYRTFESISLFIKGLLLLAIWSMCLDSYFVDFDRYKKLETRNNVFKG